MKKAILVLLTILFMAYPIAEIPVYAESKKNPVYADSINNGTYNIEVTSSSSMFKIIDCELTVTDNEMTAVITLSGKGYEKLFMGTSEEALVSRDTEYIYYSENSEGKYTYTIPVEALDMELNCSAFSIRKQKWYDRTIVFESDTLPSGIVQGKLNIILIISIAVAVILITTAVIIIIKKHRRK